MDAFCQSITSFLFSVIDFSPSFHVPKTDNECYSLNQFIPYISTNYDNIKSEIEAICQDLPKLTRTKLVGLMLMKKYSDNCNERSLVKLSEDEKKFLRLIVHYKSEIRKDAVPEFRALMQFLSGYKESILHQGMYANTVSSLVTNIESLSQNLVKQVSKSSVADFQNKMNDDNTKNEDTDNEDQDNNDALIKTSSPPIEDPKVREVIQMISDLIIPSENQRKVPENIQIPQTSLMQPIGLGIGSTSKHSNIFALKDSQRNDMLIEKDNELAQTLQVMEKFCVRLFGPNAEIPLKSNVDEIFDHVIGLIKNHYDSLYSDKEKIGHVGLIETINANHLTMIKELVEIKQLVTKTEKSKASTPLYQSQSSMDVESCQILTSTGALKTIRQLITEIGNINQLHGHKMQEYVTKFSSMLCNVTPMDRANLLKTQFNLIQHM